MSIKEYLRAKHPNIFSLFHDLNLARLSLCAKIAKRIPRTELTFEVPLVEHCNLNCMYCGHFSPVAQPEFLDVEVFEREIKRMGELFKTENRGNKRISQLRLLGGEPLLHPDINKFLSIARKYLGDNVQIKIITNGLLLPKMSEEFWNCCRENNIIISPTKYPISFDYEKVEQLAKDRNVDYRYYNNAKISKYMNKIPLDPKGGHSISKEFGFCPRATHCPTLRHGRLYPCPLPQAVRHLNNHFGTNFIVSQDDSIDIYEAKSARGIMKFLANPIPFCRYCNFENKTEKLDWQRSNCDLSEWVQ